MHQGFYKAFMGFLCQHHAAFWLGKLPTISSMTRGQCETALLWAPDELTVYVKMHPWSILFASCTERANTLDAQCTWAEGFVALVHVSFIRPMAVRYRYESWPCSSGIWVFCVSRDLYFALCIICSGVPVDKKENLQLWVFLSPLLLINFLGQFS